MKLQNYFKITLKVDKQISASLAKNIIVNFSRIKMYSEEEDRFIEIKDRKFISIFDKKNPEIVYLYIQNDGTKIKDRIDYLLDEDWKIDTLFASIVLKNSFINLPYTISSYEQVFEFEYSENNSFIEDFLNKKYINKTVCILGPKPNKLYGYNMKNKQYLELKEKISNALEGQIIRGKNIVLTNGYIGGETLGYEVAKNLKNKYDIENVLAVPFLKLEDKWVDSSKKQYYEMIKEADAFLEIDKIKNYKYGTPEIYTKEKMLKKNDFDIDFASTFIVINDNEGTLNMIKHSIEFANKELIVIDAFDKILF